MDGSALEGGFANPPIDAAHAFRGLMEAMARPGLIKQVEGVMPPAPLSQAAGVVLATLCDPETPVFLGASLEEAQVRDWITFHTGAPLGASETAQFAFGTWEELKDQTFQIGTSEYPDRSTTLVVSVDDLTNVGATLSGPGIQETAKLSVPETAFFQRNAALFPLGLDVFFTAGDRIAALPRTTKVS
jgi:alpha-D-ribose 1-methylphosphonate 5-triphosphate synthase subunit PhnH